MKGRHPSLRRTNCYYSPGLSSVAASAVRPVLAFSHQHWSQMFVPHPARSVRRDPSSSSATRCATETRDVPAFSYSLCTTRLTRHRTYSVALKKGRGSSSLKNAYVHYLPNHTASHPLHNIVLIFTAAIASSLQKVRVSWSGTHALKAYSGRRGRAPLIPNLGIRRGRVVRFTLRPLYLRGNNRIE